MAARARLKITKFFDPGRRLETMSLLRGMTLIMGLVAVWLSSGCTVVRVLTHQDSFSKLDPHVRQQVWRGRVELGYNQATVFLALGRPNYRSVGANATGSLETWSYTALDVTDATGFTASSSLYANVTPTINVGWITFTDGKVTGLSENFAPDTSQPHGHPVP